MERRSGSRETLKWFSHVEKMESGKFVKKVYESVLEDPNRRGRPLGRWKESVEEYLGKSGITGRRVLEEARTECGIGRGGNFFAAATPLGYIPGGSEASEL